MFIRCYANLTYRGTLNEERLPGQSSDSSIRGGEHNLSVPLVRLRWAAPPFTYLDFPPRIMNRVPVPVNFEQNLWIACCPFSSSTRKNLLAGNIVAILVDSPPNQKANINLIQLRKRGSIEGSNSYSTPGHQTAYCHCGARIEMELCTESKARAASAAEAGDHA